MVSARQRTSSPTSRTSEEIPSVRSWESDGVCDRLASKRRLGAHHAPESTTNGCSAPWSIRTSRNGDDKQRWSLQAPPATAGLTIFIFPKWNLNLRSHRDDFHKINACAWHAKVRAVSEKRGSGLLGLCLQYRIPTDVIAHFGGTLFGDLRVLARGSTHVGKICHVFFHPRPPLFHALLFILLACRLHHLLHRGHIHAI